MSATYKIVGVDGRQYGPVSADQIRRWIAEGRIESRTPIFTGGTADWTFAGLLPEFANPVAQLGGALEFLLFDGATQLLLQLLQLRLGPVLLDLRLELAQGH